jgi:hypothetical protein
MGGSSSKKKTRQTYEPPSWVTGASQSAIVKGRNIANQRYTPYKRDRVAGLSDNEQEAMWLARSRVGEYKPYYEESAALARRGTQQFSDANIQDYMNPYIKGALDPVAREIGERGAREMNALDARAASMDAFGGSRAALLRSETQEKTLQQISDLYGQGYAQAYESAVSIWGSERARDLEAAGRFQALGTGAQQASQQDVANLLTTGLLDREVRQAAMDFDYQQFIENRDWDLRGLSALLASIQGTKGSYRTETTSTTKVKEDNTAEVVGGVVQLIGMAMMASDSRLKENIRLIAEYMGIKLYTCTWNNIAKSLGFDVYPTVGVIAQENPEFVIEHESGFLMVDYRRLLGGL